MITPFQVYLVMQLNSIIGLFIAIAVVSGIAIIAISVFVIDLYPREERIPSMKLLKKFVTSFALSCLMIAVIPSTQTAAAMIIIPALTSKEVTQPLAKEGKELYDLAKRALTDMIDEPKEKQQ